MAQPINRRTFFARTATVAAGLALADAALDVAAPQMAGATESVSASPAVSAAAGQSTGGSTFSFPYLHRALGSVLSGVGDRKLGLIGDSTTWGYGGVNGIGPANNLAKLLTAAGIPAALGLTVPVFPAAAAFPDTRWSVGTGWSQVIESGWSFGGFNSTYVGASGAGPNTLTFTPSGGYQYDTFDVWYIAAPALGSFTMDVDGGISMVVITTGSPAIAKATIKGSASATHVLKIGSVTPGGVLIVGIEPSLSTTPRLRIANMGVGGSTSTTWSMTTPGGYSSIDAIRAYAADVWIINLGVNDASDTVTSALYLADLHTIAQACALSGDVFVASPVPSGTSATTLEAAYAAALPAFCASNGYGFIDLFDRWGGAAAFGKLQPLGYYHDTLHPGPSGYPDIALAECSALMTT
jgi:lysophospholipase L1-like esterase